MADINPITPPHSLESGGAHSGNANAHPTASLHRLTLVKGEHRWLFRWSVGDEPSIINSVADLARNPDMPFDWLDAAVVCKHIAQPLRGPQ